MEEEKIYKELNDLILWFEYYDNQIKQYQRCIRLGIEFDKDVIKLDQEAIQKQNRIKELRKLVIHENILY
jgi:hypothetical protein